MGSFCSTAPETTSQSVAPNPMAARAYQDILSRAQSVASQPYAAYQGQLTAGLDPTQQAGISNINASYGMAQPYFAQAGQYAQQGAAPVANISGADIQRYQNPFQQSVIDATLGNINEADQRQQQMIKSNAAMSGALGGDRQAVAQAELARQQGLARNQTLAGLQSQGYSQALSAAQSQQQNQQANAQRAAQAAGIYGNLGAGAQQAQLQGAGAQLGAGQVAQQTEQQRLNALYGQFQQQQAFPYQQLGWLSGIASPIGSQMGQTQTNVGPEKDNTSQYLGLGLSAAASIFSDERMKENIHQVGELYDGKPVHRYNYKGDPTTQIGLLSQEVERDQPEAVHHVNGMGAVDYDAATAGSIRRAFGGRVGYADGGSPYNFIMDSEGYIPRSPQLSARPMQIAQMPKQQEDQGMKALGSGVNALAGSMGKSGFSGLHDLTGGATSNFGFNSSMMPDYFGSNYGSADQLFPGYGGGMTGDAIGGFGFADGGLVDTVRAIRRGLKSYADGGEVPGTRLARRHGQVRLREEMGGEPAFFGPLQRALFGDKLPLYGRPASEVERSRRQQMQESEDISEAVPRRGHADGGFVDDMSFADRFGGELPFVNRWGPVEDMPPPVAGIPTSIDVDGGNWAPQEVNPQAMADWRGGADLTMADAGGPRMSPAVELPPEITAGRSGGDSPYPMPSQALGYDSSPMAPAALMGAAPQEAAAKRAGLLGLLTEEQQAGLLAAGAGMMSGSRNRGEGLRNLGLGIQQGMGAMAGVRKEKRTADAEARKLMHDLKRDDLAERQFKQRQTLEERKLEETIRQRKAPKLTTDMMGNPVLIDPLTGEVVGRPKLNEPPPGAPPIHTPQEPLAPPARPPGAPTAPATPTPAEAMAKEEDGLPPNAQFVADTSGTIIAPWRNPQAIEGLRPADQELVRAIAEGRRAFLPLQRNNRYNQYIMEKVHEYDPQADQTAFARRQRTTNFFAVGTAGGGGQNIAAMNTFGQHAKELNDLADQLDMGRFPTWNSLKAHLIQQGVGPKEAQDKIGKWQTASKAVADEGAKVFAGSQSALADREAWHKLFDVSNPKSVTKAKLQEIVKLIDGRLNSLAAQYNDGMRTNHAPPEFIKPRTREIFDSIRGEKAPAGLEGGSATGAAGAKPDAPTRFKQLIDGGKSKQEAYKTLREEGY